MEAFILLTFATEKIHILYKTIEKGLLQTVSDVSHVVVVITESL